ncbi:MAG TPA: GNAT family N-acetyltransferase [Longimicrobiales bacterium]
MMSGGFPRFAITFDIGIRTCTRGDLDALEWFGLFTEHRELIHRAFQRQEHGEVVMLLADANGFPVGQTWIDLVAKADLSIGVLWAVRVFPIFRRKGIGTRLLHAAETVLRRRGFARAEIGVEKDNHDARRLYERLGYRLAGEERSAYTYTTPDGVPMRIPVDEWLLRKRLKAAY